MGIPLETGSNDAWFDDEVGYRVDRAAYALPEVTFEPDELAVLGLASRVWQQASLAGPASRALLKLKAAGVEPDDAAASLGVEPRVAHQRAGLRAGSTRPCATGGRSRFPYRAGRTGDVTDAAPRAVGHRLAGTAAGTSSGHDRDRGATRVFRLSRIAGPVRAVGPPGRGRRARRASTSARQVRRARPGPAPTARPRCACGPAPGVGLRRRAHGDRAPEQAPGGWDEVVVAVRRPRGRSPRRSPATAPTSSPWSPPSAARRRRPPPARRARGRRMSRPTRE